jgi:hypothetical protein
MTWALVSAAVAVAGTAVSVKGSRDQQSAMAKTRLQEVSRQSEIMRKQMGLQKQQEEDSLRARKSFQENTLPAFTRENVEADTTDQAVNFAQALQAAGNQAYAGSMGGDTSQATGTVSVEGGLPSSDTNSYRNALNTQLSYAKDYGSQQAQAQAALMALGRARELGVDRLRQSGENISLINNQMSALNRPIQANDLYSQASSRLYENDSETAANKGAGTMLAGQALQSLGQLGYSYGTSKAPARTGTASSPLKAIPVK